MIKRIGIQKMYTLFGDNVGKSFLFEEMENEQPCADTFYICLLQFLAIVLR